MTDARWYVVVTAEPFGISPGYAAYCVRRVHGESTRPGPGDPRDPRPIRLLEAGMSLDGRRRIAESFSSSAMVSRS